MPVIDALILLGGKATKKETIETVLNTCNVPSEIRNRQIKSGASAIERTIEFARNDLRLEGIINGHERGIWELTDLGKKIIITDELAGKIRGKSIRIHNARGKSKKSKENVPIPNIDLSSFYQYRDITSNIQSIYEPDLETTLTEEIADEELIKDLQSNPFSFTETHKKENQPQEKPEPISINGRMCFPRNRHVAINALSLASFKCEIDSHHPTFLRKGCTYQYTEPHHLVPMAYQKQFSVSLDVEENIVSLCCTCHKQIHYGADATSLIIKLFKERKDDLIKVGILITEKDLLHMYHFSDNE